MNQLSTVAIALVLSFAATAAADEPRRANARTAGILSVVEAPRLGASYALPPSAAPMVAGEGGPEIAVPALCQAGETCDARGAVRFARPLLRSVGFCDADALAELAAEIGRLAAIEQCTGRGDVGATNRPLAPRRAGVGLHGAPRRRLRSPRGTGPLRRGALR